MEFVKLQRMPGGEAGSDGGGGFFHTIGAGIGSGVAALGNLVGQGVNAIFGSSASSRQWAHQKEMYQRMRNDALADYWMQNDYNSPQSQMKRLQEAKLNPNLIYGNGTASTGNSSMPRSAEGSAPQVYAPKFDPGSVMDSYFDTQIKKQTIDNLKTQNTVLVQDAALRAAETGNQIGDTALKTFALHKAQDMLTYDLDAASLDLRERSGKIDVLAATNKTMLDRNEREEVLNSVNVREALSRIVINRLTAQKIPVDINKVNAEIGNLNSENRTKLSELEQRAKGSSWHDNFLFRTISELANTIASGITGSKSNTNADSRSYEDSRRSKYGAHE